MPRNTMQTLADILKNKKANRDHRNSYEFQAFGNRLAEELGDIKHRALYIKLAKTEDRNLLLQALDHIKASPNATTKGRLFMWKVKQLKAASAEKEQATEKKPHPKKNEKETN
ncbi:hypothetical protein H6802_01265 [Candidatus Nomurabacteria bacterium]|nr:hypothetical protein [Candidatus Nomurabacteria bacterium]MCB9827365.1 hypothetical protein [Candidatus Nomurabacteria bacterium]